MTDAKAGQEASAIGLLTRAVELDNERRFTESMVCYQEGIHLLLEVLKGIVCCILVVLPGRHSSTVGSS